MKCPMCHSKETRVSCTEDHGDFTKRYCRCLNCKAKFRTTEKYLNTIENPGRKKGSFVLNPYQCKMIQKNKYMLARYEWAAIYEVSITSVVKAEKKNKGNLK